MKSLILFIALAFGSWQTVYNFNNTVWQCKINDQCRDILRFRSQTLKVYSCETDETNTCSYSLFRDTLIIIERYNTNGGRPEFYRKKFLIRSNTLSPLSREELIGRKWIRAKTQMDTRYVFRKR